MNIRRTLSVTRRVFRGLKHDWRSLAMMFLTPILGMVVFGVAFSGDVREVNVVVVNQDQGYQIPPSTVPVSLGDAIVANLDSSVVTVDEVATEAEGVERVRSGKAYALIIFPGNYTSDIYAKNMDPTLDIDVRTRVDLDRSNVTVANTITKVVSDAMLKATGLLGVEAAGNIDTSHAIYAKDANYRDVFLPGIMAFAVFMLTFILTLWSFVSERRSGLLQRLQATPLTEVELVIGYALAFSIIAVLQTATLIAVIVLLFDVMVVGSILLVFLIVTLLAITSLSLGILLSSLTRDESQATQMLPAVVLPIFLLSGIFWPVEALPTWLRPLSYVIPTTLGVNATRSVMLRGWGLGDVWVELAGMVGFTAAFLGLSVWSLHRGRG